MTKKAKYVFPFSFSQKVHRTVKEYHHFSAEYRAKYPLTKQWLWYGLEGISVIGGDKHLGWWGDGIHTFEVWYPGDSDPTGYQTVDDINKYLLEKHGYEDGTPYSPDSSPVLISPVI